VDYYRKDWFGFNCPGRYGKHPCEKPVDLYSWLLKRYAKPGDRILDTHGGSCSIAIACHDMGHDLTVCEIDKDYYEAAKKRLENHQKQGQLF
jgi:site-specific DNA-methyltransferase (adenine-specific)